MKSLVALLLLLLLLPTIILGGSPGHNSDDAAPAAGNSRFLVQRWMNWQPLRAIHQADPTAPSNSACPATNELDQVKHLWAMSKTKKSLFPGRHGEQADFEDYKFEVTTVKNTSKVVVLELHEYVLAPKVGDDEPPSGVKKATKEIAKAASSSSDDEMVWESTIGGGVFHATWEVLAQGPPEKGGGRWISLSTCNPSDNFDGTYTICCRAPSVSSYGISRLTVYVDYLNFEPYLALPMGKPRGIPIHQVIWQQPSSTTKTALRPAAPPATTVVAPLSKQDWPDCTDDMVELANEGEWVEVDGAFRWVNPIKGCVTPVPKDSEVEECVHRLNSITFMGDSHLRQISKWFYGYLGITGLWFGEEDQTVLHPKVKFLWNTVGAKLALRITRDLRNSTKGAKPMTDRDVVIMNTAHWDLWSLEVTNFINSSLPMVVEAVQKLR